MKNKKILIEMGLSEQDADAYLALLEMGGGGATELAKKMGTKRTSVYAMLQSLSRRGIVETYVRRKKTFYSPVKPERLAGQFEKKLEIFRNIIPMLETIEKKDARAFGLRFIESKEELENFYQEILDEYRGREYRIIGSAPAWEGIDEEFFVQFRKDRAARGIKTRLLLSADSREKNIAGPELLREFKYLPEKYIFKSTIDIFEDKILIVSPNISALAIVIAVPAMTDIFSSMFEMLWEFAPADENDRRGAAGY